jgi:uncharacterized protein YbjT (DUF2867 family)
MHILLAGATGLVGRSVITAADARQEQITTVGRRATGLVADEIVCDFSRLPALPAADVAICALGTTIAAAGSRAAFRAVDHDAVLAFASAAHQAGIEHFIVVTAVGARPDAGVFYSRVKGETERDLQALAFNRLDIAQPGLLLGPRQEQRPVEAVMQRISPVLTPFMRGPLDRYAGIDARMVAEALLALARRPEAGVYRHENSALKAAGPAGQNH